MTKVNREARREICWKLKAMLKTKPFFDCVGGCGVDTSNGESNCMDTDGIWFDYCPFCGLEIKKEYKNGKWNWYESQQSQTRNDLLREIMEEMPKKVNPIEHWGHEIDCYYCVECQEGIDIHPEYCLGFNQALTTAEESIKKIK